MITIKSLEEDFLVEVAIEKFSGVEDPVIRGKLEKNLRPIVRFMLRGTLSDADICNLFRISQEELDRFHKHINCPHSINKKGDRVYNKKQVESLMLCYKLLKDNLNRHPSKMN